MMNNYLVRESSTGDLYTLSCKDKDAAKRLFGKVVFKMEDAGDPEFDLSRVDVQITEIAHVPFGEVHRLFGDPNP